VGRGSCARRIAKRDEGDERVLVSPEDELHRDEADGDPAERREERAPRRWRLTRLR